MPRRDAKSRLARRRLSRLLLGGQKMPSAGAVVEHLTAMQSQEHAYARWSVGQRVTGSPAANDIDDDFDEGRILRTHVLRPTWHYVAPTDLRWLIGLSGTRVEASQARRFNELGLDGQTLRRTEDVIGKAVADAPLTRPELASILQSRGVATTGQRLPFLLMHAELTAVICSGPMRGKQHTYAAFDDRVPPGKGVDDEEALAELAWRYFSTRGPATLRDFSWWSGLKVGEARGALEAVRSRLVADELEGRTYWEPQGNLIRTVPSSIQLVQSYDEVIISYRESRDVLQTEFAAFPAPGHIDGFHHLLLLDGQLLGHWRVRPRAGHSRVEVRTSRPLDRNEQRALSRSVDDYRSFLGQGADGQ